MANPEEKFSILKSFKSQNISQAKSAGNQYVDEYFPPEFESLFAITEGVDNSVKVPKFAKDKTRKMLTQQDNNKRLNKYSWGKLNDILKVTRLNIFRENKNISDDVVPGKLGDNYFLSTLLALAQDKYNIKNVISQDGRASDPAFEAKVFIHGEPVSLILDNNFPVINARKLAFAGINENSGNIWPIILEKAWAKCNKSYENIVHGNSSDVLEFLTPAPIDTLYHDEEDLENLITKIKNGLKNKYLVLADIDTEQSENIEKLFNIGLITNNGYLILDVKTVKNQTGDDVTLIKMKNLLSNVEWTGDWGDNSLKWTEESKDTVNFYKKEDGVFWMSSNDFLQFFSNTFICQNFPNYSYFFLKNKAVKSSYNLTEIVVNKPGTGYFIINQKTSRIYNKLKNEKYHNPYCSMIVYKEDDNGFMTLIGSDSGYKDRLYVECKNMVKGRYYVAVAFPKNNQSNVVFNQIDNADINVNYRVCVYSNSNDITIEHVEENEDELRNKFLFDLIYCDAENKNNEKVDFAAEGEPDSWRIINFDNDKKGFGYIQYQNNSDAYLKERFVFKTLKNIVIIPYLQNGFFIQQEVQQPKNADDKPAEEVDFESDTIISVINNLKGLKLESSFKVVRERNPLTVQFNIAPHSNCTVLLQKVDDDVDINFDSDICFEYLPNIFFGEQKFPQKKFRLKYNEEPVEIYECVTEHNTGVFFQYKNRTNNLRVAVKAVFSKFENLYLNLTSSDLNEKKEIKLRDVTVSKLRNDQDDNTVSILVNPGDTGFFALSTVDNFKKYAYSCSFEYHFYVTKV